MTSIAARAASRGVRRLCHLTPVRNLIHIASGAGLMSVADLEADRAAFTQQDLARYDGRREHVSCSVEYPNVWYLRQKLGARSQEQLLYPDWVCLFLDPSLLDRPGVEFAPVNAAKAHGAYLQEGLGGFEAMYSEGGSYLRGRKPLSCPTDDQAEVMIPKLVPLSACQSVAVRDEEQARRIYSALDLMSVPPSTFDWVIAPELIMTSLSTTIRSGRTPNERRWVEGT